MRNLRLEVLVEPVKEHEPGPHVHAALAALEQEGLEPDMGPFATTVEGGAEQIASALSHMLLSAIESGATALQIRVEVSDER
ncbi:MAG: hypothetical protein GY745_02840 [Actinomycetia bacterium]|nr:hypothetical protein [Actinomycetes bacterium]MCP3909741.1 hypothetical protein [Actinomycetes bacterium]MCP4083984.1 hypothetical protein [Actinomycetes bacterium]